MINKWAYVITAQLMALPFVVCMVLLATGYRKVPLWANIFSMLLFAFGVFYVGPRYQKIIDRRNRGNKCAACGYDRKGTPDDAPCPECGKEKAAADQYPLP